MSNAARRVNERAITQEWATVLLSEPGRCVVQGDAGPYRARRAIGCLVEPEAGDRVLVALGAREAWVLSVLDREGDNPPRLSAEGDLEVSLPAGQLRVFAGEGVDVVSGASVTVAAGALRVTAGEGELNAERFSVVASTLDASAAVVKLAAGVVEQHLEQLTQRVKRAYRFAEEFEQLRAGRLDYVAKTLLQLHGATTTVTAEALVKVDAEQVHVG